MRHLYAVLLSLLILVLGTWASWGRWVENHDWKTVEKVLGFPGEAQGAGFKVWVPRKDLNVLVHGAWLDPQAGLASWFAFEPSSKDCLLTGELTVVDGEVAEVEGRILDQGLTLITLYRPYTGETPGVERIRFEGRGRRVILAEKAKALLAATGMPSHPIPDPSASSDSAWMGKVTQILGQGQVKDGVLGYSFIPPLSSQQIPVRLPSYMGMGSNLYFQPDGKQAQVYGQWVVSSVEAGPVIAALLKAHIPVTGTSSFLDERALGQVIIPFWVQGDPVFLAREFGKIVQVSALIQEISTGENQTSGQGQQR